MFSIKNRLKTEINTTKKELYTLHVHGASSTNNRPQKPNTHRLNTEWLPSRDIKRRGPRSKDWQETFCIERRGSFEYILY